MSYTSTCECVLNRCCAYSTSTVAVGLISSAALRHIAHPSSAVEETRVQYNLCGRRGAFDCCT